MREIKFRAWVNVPNANTMLQDINLEDLWMSGRAYEDYGTSRYEAETISGIKWTFKDLIFMEYTGLKDKNGVEIYDGDILRGYHAFLAEAPIYQVYWNEGGFVVRDDKGMRYNIGDVECDDMEVIGNIYANPELMKEIP